MNINSTTINTNNTTFKQLYVENRALKHLKTSENEIKKIPLIKKYSQDFDIFIRKQKDTNIKAFEDTFRMFALKIGMLGTFTAASVLDGLLGYLISASIMLLTFFYDDKKFHSKKGAYCTLEAVKAQDNDALFVKSKDTDLDFGLAYVNKFNSTHEFKTNSYGFSDINELKDDIEDLKLISELEDIKSITDPTLLIERYRKKEQYIQGSSNVLDFLTKLPSNMPNDRIYDFLNTIVNDKNIAPKFIEELLNGNTKWNVSILKEKLGEYLYPKWVNDEFTGYKKAYNDYYNNVIYPNAKSLLDLVKVSPNVAPWVIRNKSKELGIEPTIGELPQEFTDINCYRALIKQLQLLNIDICSKEKNKNFQQDNDGRYEIHSHNQLFLVEKNTEGISAKLVFKITPKNSKTGSFYIKMMPYSIKGNDYKNVNLKENYTLRPDSPYLNALVDFYLKENGCQNAADIRFYDYKTQSVVYNETVGENVDIFESDSIYDIRNNDKISNIADLGVFLNDVNKGAFKLKNHRLILIDSGHATFQDDLKPLVMGKQIALGNLSGRE